MVSVPLLDVTLLLGLTFKSVQRHQSLSREWMGKLRDPDCGMTQEGSSRVSV